MPKPTKAPAAPLQARGRNPAHAPVAAPNTAGSKAPRAIAGTANGVAMPRLSGAEKAARKVVQKRVGKAAPKKNVGLDQAALEGLVGYRLRRAEVAMRQQFARTLADWDIRGAEYSVLVLTASNELVTQADLGEALNIKRPNMVSLIERLEKRGLIMRKVHEHDRRNHILSLTEKGDALLADIEGPVHAMDQRISSCWSARERAQVMALLQRFYQGDAQGA